MRAVRVKEILLSAVTLGLIGGFAWSAMPPATAEPTRTDAAPKPTPEEIEHSAYYPSCRAARDAGHAPIFAGQPGYREELDADGDGIACEPIRQF